MARIAVEYEETHPTKESPHKARMQKMIQGTAFAYLYLSADLKNQQLTKNYAEIEKTLNAMAKVLIPKVF